MTTNNQDSPEERREIGGDRSKFGKGEKVWIYVLGLASRFADSVVPAFGEISGGCGPSLRTDFAKCMWPVVIKVKTGIPDQQLVQHLRDVADLIERRPGRRSDDADLAEVDLPGEIVGGQFVVMEDGVGGRAGETNAAGGNGADLDETAPTVERLSVSMQLCASMRHHWTAGLHSPEFHHAVRRDCPTATLEEVNDAADAVWAEFGGEGEEAAP